MCVRNCYLPSKQTHISHLLQGSLLRLTLILDYGNQQGGEEGVGGEQMWNSEVWRHSHFSLQHRNCEKKINQNFTNLGLRAICWKQSKMLKSYSFWRKKHHVDLLFVFLSPAIFLLGLKMFFVDLKTDNLWSETHENNRHAWMYYKHVYGFSEEYTLPDKKLSMRQSAPADSGNVFHSSSFSQMLLIFLTSSTHSKWSLISSIINSQQKQRKC